ncbi:uncharacterized protein [Dermacentor andersoni]|uniref:uncharacterized protein n=1 Tax=Dermacentor andersoni TaxID=34620 RepID=UPI002416ECD9|nr:mediator of RNA polymerase II transcription subunit 25-like [Dermacentor andersoni]
MGHKSVSLLGFICACCLVSADDFAWVTHEPFATENLVSIAPSGPQQVTAVAPWPQQWHSSPMQQQQQQQQQQNFNPVRMLFHSSGPWNNHGGGGGGGGNGGGVNDITTVHLQGPGPGSWQGGNAPWQTNSVAFPWQMQQHQQQSQNHHQNHNQNHGGPPGDISLPWSTQQQGHIATFTSLPSPPVQHPPNPWQNTAPMGGAPWQYQQNQNNHNNNNNNNHPHQPHQQQQNQQQSNQQHHPQQPQQPPPPEPSLPRTQVKLIYVPIPIVRSVTQQAVSSQQGQWQQQGGGGSGGGGGASVQVIWPQQQQQGGSQSAWQPGVKTRAFSVPAKTMGSAGAVIPIVISLQTTSSRPSPPAKSEFSPRVATSRADTPRSAWW